MQDPKNCHLRTITQLSQAISLQLRHALTIEWKKLVTQQYLSHMSSQYGELRPTSGWDLLVSLRHPSKFQWILRHCFVTAWHSSSGRQPKFVALNRGRHLHLAGRPSRWALAHILFCSIILILINMCLQCFDAVGWAAGRLIDWVGLSVPLNTW